MFLNEETKILDIINFLAPGYSYDKYLKAYGCELQKGHFPYEYMDGIGKLEDSDLPPQEAFYSRLKNKGISDEDYARCQAVWRDNGMKTMYDILVWYNNRDVVPFLDAIDKQFAFYKQLLLLLHLFPLLCGVDVSCETPPSRPVLRVLLRQPPLRQVVPDVIHPPPLWSSSPSFPRHLHPQYSLPYVFVFSSRNMPIPL